MRNKFFTIAIGVCAVLMMTMTFSADANAKAIYKFGGGPAGGTFQFMAGGISTYPPGKSHQGVQGAGRCFRRQRGKPAKSRFRRLCLWRGLFRPCLSGAQRLMKNDPKNMKKSSVCPIFTVPRLSWWLKRAAVSKASKTWPARKSAWAMPAPGLSPTANSFSPTWVSGTRSNATPWVTTMQLPPSATTSWMPSGCSWAIRQWCRGHGRPAERHRDDQPGGRCRRRQAFMRNTPIFPN